MVGLQRVENRALMGQQIHDHQRYSSICVVEGSGGVSGGLVPPRGRGGVDVSGENPDPFGAAGGRKMDKIGPTPRACSEKNWTRLYIENFTHGPIFYHVFRFYFFLPLHNRTGKQSYRALH